MAAAVICGPFQDPDHPAWFFYEPARVNLEKPLVTLGVFELRGPLGALLVNAIQAAMEALSLMRGVKTRTRTCLGSR